MQKRPVLYVDDEEANLIVFEAAFEDYFDVTVVSTASEALAILESTPIPVVIADQRMPEMTGVEMFSVLRQRDPHVQRIVLSGFTDSESLIDAINSGQIFQFVRKPWDQSELMSVILSAFDAHDMSRQNSILEEKLILSERCATLGQSAARITHEMGNHMGLLPLIETIEEEYGDPQLIELAQIARTSHERLMQLINEIQALVRSEGDTVSLKPTSITVCIRELVSFLRFNDRFQSERLTTKIDAELIVLANRFKLQQVIMNLVWNAVDAIKDCEDGRIILSVEQDDRRAEITLTDNGHGITPDVQAKMWTPFFTTKGKSGSGLGLDIVKSIIEAHRGEITCESIPGSGTTFRISLPLSVQNLTDIATIVEPAFESVTVNH